MKFSKYHALGNDYIVINPDQCRDELTKEMIRLICHRNYGAGSDGILLGPFTSQTCDFGLKIYNPDGTQAEKSGNGLRIFARFLCDNSFTESLTFTIETLGGNVVCEVSPDYKSVKVEMGKVSFDSSLIPVEGQKREVLNEKLEIDDKRFTFCAATIGNPHCIILSEKPDPLETIKYGPLIEIESRFPNRTNVQFMKVIDRNNIQIEIWERGAGYTLASGSSSTASAAVAHRLGLCDSEITVHMTGGKLKIKFTKAFSATMTGPVTQICHGTIVPEVFKI